MNQIYKMMSCPRVISSNWVMSTIRQTIMEYSNLNSSLTYTDTLKALNNLQSNASYLRNAPKHDAIVNTSLDNMRKYILRSGITFEQLDKLSIIHVAGTKGKGSTCAFVEKIIREHGYQTGLYTSPHLVSVRERIKINGRPISEEDFIKYFWVVYGKLMSQRVDDNDMPGYFRFMTILMFHVFLKAKLDVVIVEVGIGGEHDCTNIIKNPVCIGISKLDLDHVKLLGDNLKLIAYQKSGIFKNYVPAFTVPQSSEAMETLYDRAKEKNCDLKVVPTISSYFFMKNPPVLGISSNVQYYNASLAIQLSKAWLTRKRSDDAINNNQGEIDMTKVEAALASCQWPGRTQILRGKCIDFYLDGAHTLESIRGCIEWFKIVTKNSKKKKVLMFNSIGDRDAKKFMDMLKTLDFHQAYFVPNVSGIKNIYDHVNKSKPAEDQTVGCEINCRYWGPNAICATSVFEALNLIRNNHYLTDCINEEDKIELLITGSLHLVGAALTVLDSNLTMSTNY